MKTIMLFSLIKDYKNRLYSSSVHGIVKYKYQPTPRMYICKIQIQKQFDFESQNLSQKYFITRNQIVDLKIGYS